MNLETFKDIPSAPGYRVSDLGRVWSMKRKRAMPVTPHVKRAGHLWVPLWVGGKVVQRKVHHLVLEAFGVPRPPNAGTRHIDGNPANNSLNNLVWGTQAENMADRERHGNTPKHERHGKAKLTMPIVCEARRRFAAGEPVGSLAKRYGVNAGTMSKAVRNLTWRMPS